MTKIKRMVKYGPIPIKDSGNYRCPLCRKARNSLLSIWRHIREKHNDKKHVQ